MGGMARSEINSRGLAKSDFAEIEFHRIPEHGGCSVRRSQDLGRCQRRSRDLRQRRRAAAGAVGPPGNRSAERPAKACCQPEKGNALNLAVSAVTPADFKGIASMLNTTPTSLPGAKIISAAEARSLMANGVKIYDVRVQEEYDHGHVPGSIMVPCGKAVPRKSTLILLVTTSISPNNCRRERIRCS